MTRFQHWRCRLIDHPGLARSMITRLLTWPDQIWDGQPEVLRRLAASAPTDAPMLEMGSWQGCSTLIIGAVARERGVKLVCVDWWGGAGDDHLSEVAARRDVFRLFWRRVCKAGLQDTVIPMRGKSQDVLPLLAGGQFGFVFVDADHRYPAVVADIAQAKRLGCKDAVICGHDYTEWEGHEGVVRAVEESWRKFEVMNGIWLGVNEGSVIRD